MNDESAFTLARFDDQLSQIPRTDLTLDQVSCTVGGKLAIHLLVIAVRVGHRGAVNLWGERSKTVLVRHVLCGQGHSEIGPAMVGVVKRDHCLFLGVSPS